MRSVTVLGAGSWGTTLASILADRVRTTLWARSGAVAMEIATERTNRSYIGKHPIPETLLVTGDLRLALTDADVVILAVPSHGVRAILEASEHDLPHNAVILSVAKGLEEGTDLRVSEIVGACWPGRAVGVMTGPNLAGEILLGQPSASVVAFTDDDDAAAIQELLSTDRLRIYTNPDVVGCEIAGVVKNVLAIAVGMAVGLGLGDNTRAALITRALAEMTRLGVAIGGDARTFSGLAGLGDLVATCTSTKSRNFSVGVALGEGRSLEMATSGTSMVAEGVRSSLPTLDLARRLAVDVPIVEQVVAVCHEGRAATETIDLLMMRSTRPEFNRLER